MAVLYDGSSSDEKIHTRTTSLHVERPKTVDAHGLFLAVKNTLLRLGVPDVDSENCTKLVGIGSDGASANIARGAG